VWKKVSYHYLNFFLALLLTFTLGLIASTYKVEDGQSWVLAMPVKLREIFGLQSEFGAPSFNGFSSQRYEFKVDWKFSKRGVFQLAESGDQIFAINRHSGNLYQISHENLPRINEVMKVYTKLGIEKKSTKDVLPLVMDLHFAFGKLYMSIIQYESKSCERLYLYKITVNDNKFEDPKKEFKTPCISDHENSQMWGGRMTNSKNSLFLSIGEQRYDRSGFPKQNVGMDSLRVEKNSVFGTVLEFPNGDSKYSIFTTGHRNAQGLYFNEESSQLIESEHGPFGGDEINLLKRGNNYGWPFVTFGKPYPLKAPSQEPEINLSKDPRIGVDLELAKFGIKSGNLNGYSLPLFTWSPGTGPGNLVQISLSNALIDWRNNIVISLMGENTLHRLITSDGKIIADEKIVIKERVRDFIITKDGFIYASTDNGELVRLATFDSIFN